MRRRLDDLDAHLEVLVRLRRRAGVAVFKRALDAARVAVARVMLAEAERLADVGERKPKGTVAPFRKRTVERRETRDEEACA
jgi:hypothetical protein